MHSMAISRRALLALLASAPGWPLLSFGSSTGRSSPIYLAARASAKEEFLVSGFTLDGRVVFDLPLPDRGHSFALHPNGDLAVHLARRPGTFARVIDVSRGTLVSEIACPEDRHFYGHGAFSRDGRLLYATENDFEGERGIIGVYDADRGYRRTGELSSHGVGPHEIRLLSDGETLVVANGGIATHPSLPRVKLNLPTMAPSLVYLDTRDGRLLEKRRLAPELHQLSIRHLALGRDRQVAVAMQYEGPAGDVVPLVGIHRPGQDIRLLEGPREVLRSMNQYCGSTAFDLDGKVLGVSAPRGNIVTFWDADTARFLSSVTVPDCCGIAPGSRSGRFLVSSGRRGVFTVEAGTAHIKAIASDFLLHGRWDNHMVSAGL